MLIHELLDTKVDYQIIKDSGGEYIAARKIGDRTIEVNFLDTRSKETGIYLVGFFEIDKDGNKSMRVTNSGSALEVLRMVSDVITDFITERKPNKIMFQADSEKGKNSRSDVYERLLKKFKMSGYSFDRKANSFGSTTYFNIRKDGFEG
jgi:hypothetical protein